MASIRGNDVHSPARGQAIEAGAGSPSCTIRFPAQSLEQIFVFQRNEL